MKIKTIKNLFTRKKSFVSEKFLVLAVLFLAASIRLVFEVLPGSADVSWYDTDWKYRQKLTLNNTLILSNEASFPLLVKTTQTALKSIWSGGRVGKVNGGDILFTASNGTTKLAHEIESYSFSSGELIAWVYLPTISTSGTQEVYMYYGNENATDQWDTTGAVWQDRYNAVYHFGENCSTAGCYKDSVTPAYTNHATPYSGDSIANISEPLGKIGRGVSLDGEREYLKIADSGAFDLTDDFSIESFVQVNELNRFNGILDKGAFSLKTNPDGKYEFIGMPTYGTSSFTEVESFGANYNVTSLAEYGGLLFVTLEGENSTQSATYKSNDGVQFESFGSFGIDEKIGGLTVFKGELYMFAGNKIYVSDSGMSWNTVYTGSEDFSSMVVFENYLYAGSSETGLLYRSLTGSSWSLAEDFSDSDVKDLMVMSVYDGNLFVGGDIGRVMISGNGVDFSLDEDFGSLAMVTAMGVYDGKFIVGLSGVYGEAYYRNFAGTYTQVMFPEF